MGGKKFGSYALIGLFSIMAALLFMGCSDDDDGLLGTGACGDCHNVSTDVFSRQIQWAASVHATGGHFKYSDASCAGCHTSEGFIELVAAGGSEAPEAIAQDIHNSTPQNCHTCHQIHTNYDETDFALTTEAPVKIRVSGETVDFGKGNLCATCHQPRLREPQPVVGGGDLDITSKYWGSSHASEAAILGGTGGYELPGSTTYTNSMHTTMVTDGCVTCHMAEADGVQSGGHTLKMGYMSGENFRPSTAACEPCHPDIDDFDVNGVQTEIAGLLEDLETRLQANDMLGERGRIVPATWSPDKAGVYLNYLLAEDDKSHGVHNAKYIRALLKNSIEALE